MLLALYIWIENLSYNKEFSSWGMHKLEIVHEKSSFFFQKKMYHTRRKRVADRQKLLKIPNASCLVHMNRIRFI